jgi:hypothetical protein
MLSIYGYKWASHLGVADNGDGSLTDAANTWKKGLAGITVEQVKHGFDALVFHNHDWPPSLPEFRKLCLSKSTSGAPTLEEVISILISVSNRKGSLAQRYRHALAFAISQHEAIDMHGLRVAKSVDAKRMVKPVYEKMLETGWNDWPDHAHEDQKAVTHDVQRSSKTFAMSALSAIKGGL